jgi:hypothetical protein
MRRLLYFEKPRLGGLSQTSTSHIPTQLVLPNGDVLLGNSYGVKQGQHEANNISASSNSIIVSWHDPIIESDRRSKSFLILTILVLINMVMGTMLVSGDIVDISQVERPSRTSLDVGGLPNPFKFHNADYSSRRYWPEYFFLMLRSLVCLVACLDHSPTALSLYLLSTVVCFFIFATSIPSILYAGRYVFDIATCYVAHGIRNSMVLHWLCPPPQAHD